MQQSLGILKIFDEMGRFSKANKLFLKDEQEIGVKGVSLQLSKQ